MTQEIYRRLSENEIVELKQLLENKLKSIEGVVEIDSKPLVIHCWTNSQDYEKKEWDQYCYSINIQSKIGIKEYLESFHESVKIESVVRDMLFEFWSEFDRNLNSQLAKEIWITKQ